MIQSLKELYRASLRLWKVTIAKKGESKHIFCISNMLTLPRNPMMISYLPSFSGFPTWSSYLSTSVINTRLTTYCLLIQGIFWFIEFSFLSFSSRRGNVDGCEPCGVRWEPEKGRGLHVLNKSRSMQFIKRWNSIDVNL